MLNCNRLTRRQKKKSGVFSAPIESTYLIYQTSKINTISGGTVPLTALLLALLMESALLLHRRKNIHRQTDNIQETYRNTRQTDKLDRHSYSTTDILGSRTYQTQTIILDTKSLSTDIPVYIRQTNLLNRYPSSIDKDGRPTRQSDIIKRQMYSTDRHIQETDICTLQTEHLSE